ncbi:MAG: PTS sugar transporter subunit IIB [Candidatus Eisenbacteria sp.]|nr:PTS sugar transporter subunit IIB [Candidatus Eisenbacteria bacterium]
MTFLLVRVDDRLLHGQVIFGWGERLQPRCYLIADDQVASDVWEQDAYRAGAPPGVRVEVRDLQTFTQSWNSHEDPGGTVVLIRGLEDLARLHQGGFRPEGGINLGGRHAPAGSLELLAFLHLTPPEAAALRTLIAEGVSLYAQELPGSPRYGSEILQARLTGLRE